MIEENLDKIWTTLLVEMGDPPVGDTSDNTEEYYTTRPEESENDEWHL